MVSQLFVGPKFPHEKYKSDGGVSTSGGWRVHDAPASMSTAQLPCLSISFAHESGGASGLILPAIRPAIVQTVVFLPLASVVVSGVSPQHRSVALPTFCGQTDLFVKLKSIRGVLFQQRKHFTMSNLACCHPLHITVTERLPSQAPAWSTLRGGLCAVSAPLGGDGIQEFSLMICSSPFFQSLLLDYVHATSFGRPGFRGHLAGGSLRWTQNKLTDLSARNLRTDRENRVRRHRPGGLASCRWPGKMPQCLSNPLQQATAFAAPQYPELGWLAHLRASDDRVLCYRTVCDALRRRHACQAVSLAFSQPAIQSNPIQPDLSQYTAVVCTQPGQTRDQRLLCCLPASHQAATSHHHAVQPAASQPARHAQSTGRPVAS